MKKISGQRSVLLGLALVLAAVAVTISIAALITSRGIERTRANGRRGTNDPDLMAKHLRVHLQQSEPVFLDEAGDPLKEPRKAVSK
jgi:hypothetical protein